MTHLKKVLDQRYILIFWLPLFASWLLMTSEGPIISAIINRLPNEVIMLAAQGIVVSLSVTIESPVINLLATSTALTKDRSSYLLLRKFTIHWMILLTVVTALFGFTPLFDLVVVKIMGIPQEVAYWVRIGLRIMLGSVVRLITSAGIVIVLAMATDFAGVVIGSTALVIGVIAEAMYATIAVQPILKDHLGPDQPVKVVGALTYKELFWFHLPLAATSFLVLLVQPMVSISLSRSPTPTLALAAWSIVFQIMLVMRAPAFALPEVVIALTDGKQTFAPLRRFTLSMAGVTSIVMVLLALTPLLSFYLFIVQDTTEAVAAMAKLGVILFIPLPALAIMISWIRGLLIDARTTRIVNAGMAINLTVSAIILILGGHVLDFPFRIINRPSRAISG